MPSIEEKRLAIEMADKIIQTRINLKNPAYYKQNNQAGDISYWKVNRTGFVGAFCISLAYM